MHHLPRTNSDHCPILINLKGATNNDTSARCFFFQIVWFAHPEFMGLFSENCEGEKVDIWNKLMRFTPKVQGWSKSMFGDLHKRKRRVLVR